VLSYLNQAPFEDVPGSLGEYNSQTVGEAMMVKPHLLGIALLGVLIVLPSKDIAHSQTVGTAGPPSVMHWCSQHCTTLTWNNGHYGGPDSMWIVEKWTRESVVIRRTDYRPYPGVAVLTGSVSAQSNSIENGTIQWTYHPCCGLSTGTFQAAWGTAIHTVPGSDQERAQPTQAAPPTPVSVEDQALRTQICTTRRIRGAMQHVEDQAVKDPNGTVLSALAVLVTGVDASAGSAKILDSKDGTDGGRYTSKDPGSFVCRGLFVHGDVKIDTTDTADSASEMTADAMKAIMSTHPTFTEWFKVKPLGNGVYQLTLLPSSIQLSKEYGRQFIYP
jgi:hypothetical protein